ncbi:MAG: hypothetical protein HOC93_02840 [Phycisphaerae bacterium]|jgi:hypothetical protein|nr:hypothetical protein [Phycisphaerae bacterium]
MFITTILVSSSLIAAGDFKIEEVLPTEAIFSCSVDDLKHVCDSFVTKEQREKLHALMSEVFSDGEASEMCTVIEMQSKEIIAKAGISEDWQPETPVGYAGFGIYPVADFEAGTLGVAMLGVIELQDPEVAKIAESMLENFTEMSGVELEMVNLAGEDVWMLDSFIDPQFIEQVPMGFGQSLAMDRIYLGSVNGYMICGTEPDGVSRAIAATSGDIEDSSLATNETYIAMSAQVGQGDLEAVVMFDNLADLMIQVDQSLTVGMFLPMLKAAIGDVDGFAESVTFAPSSDVFLDAKYSMWMPNGRDGLLGIASAVSSPSATPDFVGDDTISYSQINVDFAKIAPWFRSVMGMNPMMPMPPQQLDGMEQAIAAAVAPLGNTMHVVSSLSLPLTEESMGFLLAVECENSEAMETYLSAMMPMIGSEPREFLGYRMYPIEAPSAGMMSGGMDMSMSMAVGGGWTMLGMTHSVENALRLASDSDTAKDSENTNTAMNLISTDNATGWGFADMGESILAGSELAELQMANMIEEMEAFDPEMAAEMREQFDSQMKSTKAMNELVASFLGATAWTMEAGDQGFVAHAVLMRP